MRLALRASVALVPLFGLAALAALAVAAGPPAGGPVPLVEASMASVPAPTPTVAIPLAERAPAFAMPEATREALRTRRWADAVAGLQKVDPATLVGDQKGDWAFVLAWALTHAKRPSEALPYVALIADAPTVPADYAALLEGELLRATGDNVGALAKLEAVPATSGAWPRAAFQRAEALRDLGRTSEAWPVLEAVIARPDPAPGSAEALMALARRVGPPSDESYLLLRRLWVEYPTSSEGDQATALLSANWPSKKATWQEVGRRIERLMDKGQFGTAASQGDLRAAEVVGGDVDACRFLWAHGRSHYRAGHLSASVTAFKDIGARCQALDVDYGARGLFIAGQAQFRTGQYAKSAASNLELVTRYPRSNLADDALVHAGIAQVEGGDVAAAAATWQRALDETPRGDLVPEATFRHAFALYQQGRPDEARAAAEKLGALPVTADALHIGAGRYWAARLALYPDVKAPSVPVADPARKQAAIDGWRLLCEQMPHNFYAILAYSRLVEVAPEVAAKLAVRAPDHDRGAVDRPWAVRAEFASHPGVVAGMKLGRLGLIREALDELARVDAATLTGDEEALITELRANGGDWLLAHDAMRTWMKSHPPGTLGLNQAMVLRTAYPDRYWAEVQKNAQGYRYEPRLFHALVREESNFNRTIQSPVGARGLSQLMPDTAREVAGWMGTTVSMAQLEDPNINLKFGGRYLDSVHKTVGGSSFLALAGYNAGPGRVNQWLTAWGNVPTDEYIERIPFAETRGYVKRVMGTWQTMRWQFDSGPAFPDLSAYNHKSKPTLP